MGDCKALLINRQNERQSANEDLEDGVGDRNGAEISAAMRPRLMNARLMYPRGTYPRLTCPRLTCPRLMCPRLMCPGLWRSCSLSSPRGRKRVAPPNDPWRAPRSTERSRPAFCFRRPPRQAIADSDDGRISCPAYACHAPQRTHCTRTECLDRKSVVYGK